MNSGLYPEQVFVLCFFEQDGESDTKIKIEDTYFENKEDAVNELEKLGYRYSDKEFVYVKQTMKDEPKKWANIEYFLKENFQ